MIIVQNKKVLHDYFVEESIEAGLVLQGWEVKSIRANRVQLKQAYVVVTRGELWLIGAHISPLPTTSTHLVADPVRTRKLLLKERQVSKLIGAVERAGYALMPLDLHMSKGKKLIKLNLALVKGKKKYDKREDEKQKEWGREQQRLLKGSVRRS